MKIKLHYVLISLALLLVSACNDDNDEPTINRTVLVYIMGDNTLKSYVNDDIKEMMEGAANVDLTRNNLLVYVDNGTSVKLFRMNKDKSGAVVQDLIQTFESNRNSVGFTEMKEVFSFVHNKYPADTYGLVLWSHGEGWKPGTTTSSRWIGQDGNETLSISTLNNVLSVFPYCEYILFDACFMQSIEVAYELRQHTGHFIGSPAEIPGPGAPYQLVVPALFARDNAAIAIAGSYYDYYDELYTGELPKNGKPWTGGVAISVIAANQLEALAAATKRILPDLIQNGAPINVTAVLDYDRRTSGRVGYYDFKLLMEALAANTSVELAPWITAFETAVPFAESTENIYTALVSNGMLFSVKGYSGVSSYVPQNNNSLNESYKTFQWYRDAGWSETGW